VHTLAAQRMGCGHSASVRAHPDESASAAKLSLRSSDDEPRLFDPSGSIEEAIVIDPDRMAIQRLFGDPVLLRLFTTFAASRFAEENVMFLRDLFDGEKRVASGDATGALSTATFLVRQTGHAFASFCGS
jgi:hypothetical protein